MATAELSREKKITGDNGAIQQILSLIPGGVTLDFGDFEGDLLQAGHVIYKEGDKYKPVTITRGKYLYPLPPSRDGSMGECVGVLIRDVSKNDPRASILTAGQVNCGAVPFPIHHQMKRDLPRVDFLYWKDPERPGKGGVGA